MNTRFRDATQDRSKGTRLPRIGGRRNSINQSKGRNERVLRHKTPNGGVRGLNEQGSCERNRTQVEEAVSEEGMLYREVVAEVEEDAPCS